jgi:hypothetical protein
MSSKLSKKQKELLCSIQIATDPENIKYINKSLIHVKRAHKQLSELIRKIEKVNLENKVSNRENAITTYKYYFIKVDSKFISSKEKMAIKQTFIPGEIEKFLNKESKLPEILRKLKTTQKILKNITGPCEKALKFYDTIHNTANVVNKVDDLLKQQDKLKTADDYRKYYLGLAGEFSKVATSMKSITRALPRGASDYCEFIFTVAENGVKAAKIVSKYSGEIIKRAVALDELGKKAYGKQSYFTTGRDADSFNSNEKGVDYVLKNR